MRFFQWDVSLLLVFSSHSTSQHPGNSQASNRQEGILPATEPPPELSPFFARSPISNRLSEIELPPNQLPPYEPTVNQLPPYDPMTNQLPPYDRTTNHLPPYETTTNPLPPYEPTTDGVSGAALPPARLVPIIPPPQSPPHPSNSVFSPSRIRISPPREIRISTPSRVSTSPSCARTRQRPVPHSYRPPISRQGPPNAIIGSLSQNHVPPLYGCVNHYPQSSSATYRPGSWETLSAPFPTWQSVGATHPRSPGGQEEPVQRNYAPELMNSYPIADPMWNQSQQPQN